MAFQIPFAIPRHAHNAFMEAYPHLTAYRALRQECMRRGLTDENIRALAVKNNTTVTEICRRILVADKPALALAWPKSSRTPRQADGYTRRRHRAEINMESARAGIDRAAAIIQVLLGDNDSMEIRRRAKSWLKTYGPAAQAQPEASPNGPDEPQA